MEVRTKRVGVGPMLEKHQPQRILGIVVDRVEKASRFLSGALHVLQAQREDTLEGVSARPDAASDQEHELTLSRGRNGERATQGNRSPAATANPVTAPREDLIAMRLPRPSPAARRRGR